ncbi:MAG TPA: PVC-type heme-binding CxxCH protein [Verrucomicrobiaceae bacterium]
MKPSRFRLCRLCVILALTPAAFAASFKFDGQTLTVPDGFVIERIAGSPLVDRPISAAFDDRGFLYVTDSAGMSDGAEKQIKEKAHRLLRLEDTDGDGRFDRRTEFADHLMFPEGCLYHEGSVYVAAPPEIWKFTDRDGDGVAERCEVWFDGKTLTHCGNDLHGPYLGRDGWLYWTKGAHAAQHYNLPDGRVFDTRSCHIFRARPDATMLEPVFTGGMENPVGIAFTPRGELILSGTFFWTPAAGERDGLIHSIYGGVYGRAREDLADHPMTGGIMPNLTQTGASAPCGMICCEGNQLGENFRGSFFTCYFNLHKVMRHELTPTGATFKTRETDFVSSDSPDFHPTDVIEDADGSLLVVDTGGWYKICCPTSQLAKPDVLGAIYRVRRADAPKIDDPRGAKIKWSGSNAAALVVLLADERHTVRDKAIRELAHRGAAALPALKETITNSPSIIARQNAVWTLSRIDDPEARAAVRSALADSDPSVVQVAAHVAAVWHDHESLEELTALLRNPGPAIARVAAEGLGRLRDPSAVRALLAAAGRLGVETPDESGAPASSPARVAEHSIIYALIEIGDAPSMMSSLESPDPRIRRAALVALDQLKQGRLSASAVTPLLNHADDMLRLTAAWIVSHHPEWGDGLADHFRGRLHDPPADEPARTALEKQLANLAKSSALQSLLAFSARHDSGAGQVIALRAMARAGISPAPAAWLEGVAALLSQSGGPTLTEAVATARALPLPKGGHESFTRALVQVGRRQDVSASVRLDALVAAGGAVALEPSLFEFLMHQVAASQPMQIRGAAAAVLAKSRLKPEQQLALAGSLKDIGPLEIPKLLPAFEQNAGETLGHCVIAALKESAGLGGLRVDLLKTLLAKYPAAVQQEGVALIALVNGDAAKQAAHLDELLLHLPSGDVRRGQAVMLRAGCLTCHSIGYNGGRFGPDLTNIGNVRTLRDLVEAIVYPSASLVRGYETISISTQSGAMFAGIVARENADEVVLNLAPQVQQHVARSDISQMNPINLSLMPQGFGDLLPPGDLADLIAFLRASRR